MKDKSVTSSTDSQKLVFFVNGIKIVDFDFDPSWTLIEYLRMKLGLSGTKYGCGEGGCGACTVMVSRYCRITNKISILLVRRHLSVNACLTPLPWVHGTSITTIEGIGSTKTKMHAVQERLAKSHGSQCGFCTPGFVMSMYTLLRNNPMPTMEEIEEYFQGNLCRCTGYRAILEGYQTFTSGGGCQGCPGAKNGCCRNGAEEKGVENGHANGLQEQLNGSDESGTASKLIDPKQFVPYDPTQEPIFPPELQMNADVLQTVSLKFEGPTLTWYRPVSLKELLVLKRRFPDAKIIGGNTEVALEMRQKGCEYPVLISSEGVPELHQMEIVVGSSGNRSIRIGAASSLSEIETYLRVIVADYPEEETSTYRAILEMLEWFAGKQVRNMAAIGGNIATSSPISDLNPLLMAGNAKVLLSSVGIDEDEVTERTLALAQDFFIGYRKNAMMPVEILVHVEIPFTSKLDFVTGFKQARRRDDDIAIVNAGLRVTFRECSIAAAGDADEFVVDECCLAFGGLAAKTIRASSTEIALHAKHWNDEEMFEAACEKLISEIKVPYGAPGGKEEYRGTLALSFFYKFWTLVKQQLKQRNMVSGDEEQEVPTADLSATQPYKRGEFGASQVYHIVPDGQPRQDPVGRPVVLKSAFEQCTGEARFLDDMPPYANALHMCPVLSTRAKAKVLKIDTSQAEMVPGYKGIVTADDIPSKSNSWGVFGDDKIFYSDEVSAQGQIVCAVVADTREGSRVAARKVQIEYEDIGDPILTIQEAIQKKSYFVEEEVSNGDPDEVFKNASYIVKGEVRVGGQEHFYLETQGTLVVPKNEHGEMEIFATTQDPAAMQHWVSSALGVPANRTLIRVKRLGGGFGGKETRNGVLTVPASVAAAKYGLPILSVLERYDDMKVSGQRHGFFSKYRLAADSNGKLLALDLQLYLNAGYSRDLSPFVIEKSMLDCTNAYEIPVVRVRGYACQTNLTSNTAFRGFGAIQSMLICEQYMSHMADKLALPQKEFREKNLKEEGCVLYYGQVLTKVTLQRCWKEVIESSKYAKRLEEVKRFNQENRWKKRALAVTPETYGISFTAACMNQGGALVHVYRDGSVLVTHGGVEMGQGLHTKMIQVASRALQIPPSYIHTSEVGTDKVPNTISTAASFSADLNGPAVQQACEKLLHRLEPYIAQNPKGKWEDWVKAANLDCVSLSATGFYKSPTVHGLFEHHGDVPKGHCNVYHSYGVAVSEVEIDCLTGDHKVLRTDIVFDCGDSINPAVDVGQIEGGFVQGYGLWTLEDIEFGPDGQIRTVGPSTYKIPSSRDIPEVFNVALLKGAPNPHAIYSSKAVGEPPLFLSASIFFAIREAIAAYRQQNGITGHFQLDSPATSERIRMLCEDDFTAKIGYSQPPYPSDYRPWVIQI